MKVQLTLQIHLKDRPDGYAGLTSETWVVGKEDDLGLFDGIARVFAATAPYYAMCQDVNALNADVGRLAEWLQGVEFKGPEE